MSDFIPFGGVPFCNNVLFLLPFVTSFCAMDRYLPVRRRDVPAVTAALHDERKEGNKSAWHDLLEQTLLGQSLWLDQRRRKRALSACSNDSRGVLTKRRQAKKQQPSCQEACIQVGMRKQDIYVNVLDWNKANVLLSGTSKAIGLWRNKRVACKIPLEAATCVRWTDQDTFAVATKSRKLLLYDATTQLDIQKTEVSRGVVAVVVSGGNCVLWQDSKENICTWDLRHNKVNEQQELGASACTTTVAALSNDKMQCAFGSNEGILSLFDVRALKRPLHRLQTEPRTSVMALAWSPTDTLAASFVSMQDCQIGTVERNGTKKTFGLPDGACVTCLAWLTDSDLVFTTFETAHLSRLPDLARPLVSFEREETQLLVDSALSADRKTFVAADQCNEKLCFFDLSAFLPTKRRPSFSHVFDKFGASAVR